LEIERRRGLKLKAMWVEVGDEGWSWRWGLELKKVTRLKLKKAPRPCKTINGNWKGVAIWLLPLTSVPDIIAPAPSPSRVNERWCVVLDGFAPETELDAQLSGTY
jgi:hypothetical protein